MTLRDWHLICLGGNAVALQLSLLLGMPWAAAVNGMCIVWCVLMVRNKPE